MLKGENIICISSIDWDFNWQGHQEIMSAFARNDNRVLFIENTGIRAPGIRDLSRLKKRVNNWFKGIRGIREERENLFIFSPLLLPFPYSKIARFFNKYLVFYSLRKWLEVMDFSDPIIWTFLPTGIALDIIENLNKKLVVYYCIADFTELAMVSKKKVNRSEQRLLKRADVVFVQGGELYENCKRYNDNVSIFPFGVQLDTFRDQDPEGRQPPTDLQGVSAPIIGYVGGIHRHVDLQLLEHLAKNNPDWSLVLVGPAQIDITALKAAKNIFVLEEKPHRDLPDYIRSFDVCLIPYVLSEYTRSVYPTKLNEYLAMGKPVVSTQLPEVVNFNQSNNNVIRIGNNFQEFEHCVTQALNEKSEGARLARIKAAAENSWAGRINQMSRIIQEAAERKQRDKHHRWKENLREFYRTVRRRTLKAVVLGLLAYLLLFRTALVWWIAQPLRITESPVHSQAIVVFGGGVGEAGFPGTSTVERARYAALLHQRGYAKAIIFSTGYIYSSNDAENMKLFAVSVGVPEEEIILEQKANSTYENAKFTKQILDQKGWDSILLVSSPYNMRRASLVFRKLDPDLKITPTPVIKPQFYARGKVVRWAQIRAIAHEYLGILYYWWKGYI